MIRETFLKAWHMNKGMSEMKKLLMKMSCNCQSRKLLYDKTNPKFYNLKPDGIYLTHGLS